MHSQLQTVWAVIGQSMSVSAKNNNTVSNIDCLELFTGVKALTNRTNYQYNMEY